MDKRTRDLESRVRRLERLVAAMAALLLLGGGAMLSSCTQAPHGNAILLQSDDYKLELTPQRITFHNKGAKGLELTGLGLEAQSATVKTGLTANGVTVQSGGDRAELNASGVQRLRDGKPSRPVAPSVSTSSKPPPAVVPSSTSAPEVAPRSWPTRKRGLSKPKDPSF